MNYGFWKLGSCRIHKNAGLDYVDRGAIASNGVNGRLGTCTDSGIYSLGSRIQWDFNLNNFQDGVLFPAFIVGLLVASPIFASLARSHSPFRLVGVGSSVWTFVVAGCGSSFEIWSLAICRMLVGVCSIYNHAWWFCWYLR
ncbi:hypothetical protein F2P56_020082 [Juglans regia]|uniref:Uncharacterized protein n=1 Tax=Juglans regia TaxID=51240 RepID=A0A833UQ57_JUGRE|nr:hypothetical protein F2P56_020082 [Juglans regia]